MDCDFLRADLAEILDGGAKPDRVVRAGLEAPRRIGQFFPARRAPMLLL